MQEPSKTNQELQEEIFALKQRISELEQSETECKRKEEAFRESEELSHAIFKEALNPILVTNQNGEYINANAAALSFLETDLSKLLGKTVWEYSPKDLQEQQQREHSPFSRSRTLETEYQVNEKRKTLLLNVVPKQMMQGTILLGIGQDITERKRAEEALQESERKYRLLADRMTDIVWISDLNFNTTYLSPSIEFTLGVTPEERIGSPFKDQVTPDTYTRVMERLAIEMAMEESAQSDPNRTVTMEMEYYHRNGSIVWMDNIVSAIRNDDGQLIGLQGVARNITARRQAEAKLKQQTDAMEAAIDGMALLNEKGEYIYLNKAHAKIYGYDNAGELIGKTWRILYDADVLQRFDQEIMPEFSWKRNWHGESMGKKKDGTKFPQEISLTAMTNGGLICVVRDITARKEAEEKLMTSINGLQEASWRYEALIAASNTGAWEYNDNSGFLWCSPEYFSMLGRDIRDFDFSGSRNIEQTWINLLHPDDLERASKHFVTYLKNPVGMYEQYFRMLHRDGHWVWIWSRGRSLRDKDGELTSITVGTHIDISERTAVEHALQESEAKYRQLVENINQGVLVAQDGMLKFVNPMCIKVMGYSERDLTNRPFIDFVHPDDRDTILERHIKRMRGENVPSWYEFRIVACDGSSRWIEVDSVEIQWDGKLAALAFLSDITGRKLLESQLLQAQKMKAIGTLSGGIAHDFNNILGAMIGYTELAMMEQDEGRRQRNLKLVLQACERATSLVSQILTFSRKSDVDKKPANIVHIVKEAVALLRASIPTTIEIRQNIDPGYMVALANHTQIHQIMINLCTNAAHAMRKKGGILEITLKPLAIAADSSLVSLELTPGSYLKLEISDMGHGIDQANLNRIFDPFFTTKEASEGTGLGLSVVYGIVKSHNGAITVDSILGSGSKFTVYLPALQYQETKGEIEEEVISHGNERILFVDDEPMIAALGSEMLSKSGYKVTDSTDSAQALEMFIENPDAYDLVITDMTMPCMTGIDLAKYIWTIRPDTPVILCTGHSNIIDEEQAKKEGVRRFIMKPLRHKELAKAVRGVLDEQNNSMKCNTGQQIVS